MGLFSFIKNAGAKLIGAKTDEQKEAERLAAEEAAHDKVEAALTNMVTQLGLGVDNLSISYDGSTATISGEANSSADREKIIVAIGNVDGVNSVNDQMTVDAVADAELEAQFYEVERGDTLSGISKKFYGTANRYNEIFHANEPMLSHPDKIYVGQVLRIPNA
jgi:nucleoid-associated protein YgaU